MIDVENLAEGDARARSLSGLSRHAVSVAALAWCLFQLSISSWLILDSTFVRSIHLAFALLIVYLLFPALAKPRWGLSFLSDTRKIPWIDVLLGVAASALALYITIDYEAIAQRIGSPTGADIAIGYVSP